MNKYEYAQLVLLAILVCTYVFMSNWKKTIIILTGIVLMFTLLYQLMMMGKRKTPNYSKLEMLLLTIFVLLILSLLIQTGRDQTNISYELCLASCIILLFLLSGRNNYTLNNHDTGKLKLTLADKIQIYNQYIPTDFADIGDLEKFYESHPNLKHKDAKKHKDIMFSNVNYRDQLPVSPLEYDYMVDKPTRNSLVFKNRMFYFFRHAKSCNNEAAWNEKEMAPSITDLGIRNFKASYSRITFDQYFVSPLLRTWITAVLLHIKISNNDHLELIISPYLTEKAFTRVGNAPTTFAYTIEQFLIFLNSKLVNTSSNHRLPKIIKFMDFDDPNSHIATITFNSNINKFEHIDGKELSEPYHNFEYLHAGNLQYFIDVINRKNITDFDPIYVVTHSNLMVDFMKAIKGSQFDRSDADKIYKLYSSCIAYEYPSETYTIHNGYHVDKHAPDKRSLCTKPLGLLNGISAFLTT